MGSGIVFREIEGKALKGAWVNRGLPQIGARWTVGIRE